MSATTLLCEVVSERESSPYASVARARLVEELSPYLGDVCERAPIVDATKRTLFGSTIVTYTFGVQAPVGNLFVEVTQRYCFGTPFLKGAVTVTHTVPRRFGRHKSTLVPKSALKDLMV